MLTKQTAEARTLIRELLKSANLTVRRQQQLLNELVTIEIVAGRKKAAIEALENLLKLPGMGWKAAMSNRLLLAGLSGGTNRRMAIRLYRQILLDERILRFDDALSAAAGLIRLKSRLSAAERTTMERISAQARKRYGIALAAGSTVQADIAQLFSTYRRGAQRFTAFLAAYVTASPTRRQRVLDDYLQQEPLVYFRRQAQQQAEHMATAAG